MTECNCKVKDPLVDVLALLDDAVEKLNALSVYKPKEKKKLYRYVMKKGDEWFVSRGYYENALEADLASDEDKEVIQRIDSSMIEVDND